MDESSATQLLCTLKAKKEEWAYLPLEKKIAFLECILNRAGDWGVVQDFALSHVLARKMDPATNAGSSLLAKLSIVSGFMVASRCRALIAALEALKTTGAAPEAKPVDWAAAEVPRVAEECAGVVAYDAGNDMVTNARTIVFADRPQEQAAFYRQVLENRDRPASERPELGSVCVVLGAGNQAFLGLCDTLHHMFVEGSVCLYKAHPLQASGLDALKYMMEPLIAAGYLQCVECDIATSSAIVYSPHVDKVHITGGIHTHDALVWGADPVLREQNRAAGTPVLKAKMVSELGAITPYIVVPSELDAQGDEEWTEAMVTQYAELAAMDVVDNNSCNCLACKVLILPGDAKFENFRQAFVLKFRETLQKMQLEPTWYPGTKERYDAWVSAVKASGEHGTLDILADAKPKPVGSLPGSESVLPFAIAEFASPDDVQDKSIFTTEPFSPVVTVLHIPGATVAEYTTNACRFATSSLWGNLSCAVLAPPSTYGTVLPKIVNGELLYGTVVLNGYTAMGYSSSNGTWGGVGNTLEDAQSGIGFVGNATYMFNNPRNTLVWAAWGTVSLPTDATVPAFLGRVISRVMLLGWKAVLPWFLRPRTVAS